MTKDLLALKFAGSRGGGAPWKENSEHPNYPGGAYHHITPSSYLSYMWDSMIGNQFSSATDTGKVSDPVRAVLEHLKDKLDVIRSRWFDAPPIIKATGWSDPRELLEKMLAEEVYWDASVSTSHRPDYLTNLLNIYLWLPSNLHNGPSEKIRFYDPGDEIDFFAETVVGSKHYATYRNLYEHIYKLKKAKTPTPMGAAEIDEAFKIFLEACTNADEREWWYWEYLSSNWVEVPSQYYYWAPFLKTKKLFAGSGSPKWLKNEGSDIRHGLKTPDPKHQADEPGQTGTPPPENEGGSTTHRKDMGVPLEVPSSVTLNSDVTITLDSWYDSPSGKHSVGSVENINISALLAYISEKWGQDSSVIPAELRDVQLDKLTLDVLTHTDEAWAVWEFSACFSYVLRGVHSTFLLDLACDSSGDFSVLAELGFLAETDKGQTVVWFDGELQVLPGDGWAVSGSWDSLGATLNVVELANTLGIDIDAPPKDLEPLIPALESASFTYRSATASAPELLAVTVQLEHIEAVVIRVKPETGDASWCVHGAVRVETGLSSLPLVGGGVSPEEDLDLEYIGLAWVKAGLTRDNVSLINAQISDIHPDLPMVPNPPNGADAYPSSEVMLTAGLNVGGQGRTVLALELASSRTDSAKHEGVEGPDRILSRQP
ncbi:hypothetical protein ACIBKX_33385 [Streptomyces sp. NPDC050658]|uniref:hypothetical protein n=1 Tax=unclassified Streptomyces TaxID=2593676 RepID=UPI003447C008